MNEYRKQWNDRQSEFQIALKSKKYYEAIEICLLQHAIVHSGIMTENKFPSFEDELWNNLDDNTFRTLPQNGNYTIAWHIYHVTRIEDITMNYLVVEKDDLFKTENWQKKLNISFTDTGNAMDNNQVKKLSTDINIEELKAYRLEVGKKTRNIILSFKPDDIKRKVKADQIKKILDNGFVVKEASWLLDFWGRKNISGLLLIPVTRHNLVHLNDSEEIKKKLQK